MRADLIPGVRAVLLLTLASCSTARGGGAPAAPSEPPPIARPAADSTSAHRAAADFLSAFDSVDWARFSVYLAEDITMFFPFPGLPARVDGRTEVGAVFQRFFESVLEDGPAEPGQPPSLGIDPRDLKVQMIGTDGAVASFHLGGQRPARRSVVLRRTGADRWQVVHWHASAPTPEDPQGSG